VGQRDNAGPRHVAPVHRKRPIDTEHGKERDYRRHPKYYRVRIFRLPARRVPLRHSGDGGPKRILAFDVKVVSQVKSYDLEPCRTLRVRFD